MVNFCPIIFSFAIQLVFPLAISGGIASERYPLLYVFSVADIRDGVGNADVRLAEEEWTACLRHQGRELDLSPCHNSDRW